VVVVYTIGPGGKFVGDLGVAALSCPQPTGNNNYRPSSFVNKQA